MHIKQEHQEEREQSPLKKLAFETPKATIHYSLTCLACNKSGIPVEDEFAAQLTSTSSFIEAQVQQSWQLELAECTHAREVECNLNFAEGAVKSHSGVSPNSQSLLKHCNDCELTKNLWLCIHCGHVGCGRKYFDGTGGNNHASLHFSQTQHALAVKLGTFSGNAPGDFYCYACQDSVKCPKATNALSALSHATSSEKSTFELELELNQSFSPAESCTLLRGPNLAGIKNIGNTCYIASIMQCIFKVPAVKDFFNIFGLLHMTQECKCKGPECFFCQCTKMCVALTKGSIIGEENVEISPLMLKSLFSSAFGRFSDTLQQDAHEFCEFFLEAMQTSIPSLQPLLRAEFEWLLKTRLKCTVCSGIAWRQDWTKTLIVPLPSEKKEGIVLQDAVSRLFEASSVEFECQGCGSQAFEGKTWISHVPASPIVVVSRYSLRTKSQEPEGENTEQVTKNQIMLLKTHSLNLEPFLLQQEHELLHEDEYLLPQTASGADEESVALLESMGFARSQCIQALNATKGQGIEAATEWLFSCTEEPQESKKQDSHFALRAFVEHKGKHTACGHYISYCTVNDKMVTFNDEVVCEAKDCELHQQKGYIYFYRAGKV